MASGALGAGDAAVAGAGRRAGDGYERRPLIPNSFHTPNAVVDELCKLLTPEENTVVSVVCRMTFGWQKWRDRISLSRFADITGMSRPALIAALAELRRFRVLVETAPNEAGQGAEWALQLDLAEMDFAGLEERREARRASARRRTESARSVGLTGQPDLPRVGQSDLPTGGQPDLPQVGQWDLPRAVSGTDSQKPRQKPMETQEAGHGVSGVGCRVSEEIKQWGRPGIGETQTAGASEASLLLSELKVGTELIAWVLLSPQRCYWACHWAVWLPAVRGRVNSPAAFLRARIEGACNGRTGDQEAPKEWFEKTAAAERRAAMTARRPAAAAGPVIEEGCEKAWAAYLAALDPAQAGFLGGARRVEREADVLVVTLPAALLAHLRKSEARMAEKALAAGVEGKVEFRGG